jgi:two-component system, chemotaxis family, protein-glutamate methylesterase/glutaminase
MISMAVEKKEPIRVLVVDDSYFMRKILLETLNDSAGELTVIDTAQNGLEAIEKNKRLKPDVITMDVEMPKMDGLTALEKIMKSNPIPVVMLSSHTGKGTDATIRALELGAIDCVTKPAGKVLGDIKKIQGELVEKIKIASLCRVRHREQPSNPVSPVEKKTQKAVESETVPPDKPALFIVAVASSTGGPRALNELFLKLKRNPWVAFVIVQHISVGFTKALARRLGEVSSITVSEATEGQFLMGGNAYVAPGGIHLGLQGTPGFFRFTFNDHPPRLGVKPSADIMMASVAKVAAKQCLGVVLTGMGKDGTEGLKEIRKVGGKTFAQDAESCVVYGMPKAAVESGVIDRQLPLGELAEEINDFLLRLKAT